MRSITTTNASHYDIQKQRRADFIDEWRGYRKTIIGRSDVTMVDDPIRRRGGASTSAATAIVPR